MLLLKDCLDDILRRLTQACDQKQFEQICEGSRELLSAGITCRETRELLFPHSQGAAKDADWYWAHEGDLEAGFRKAVACCKGPFSDNVIDRYIDFLVIKYLVRLRAGHTTPHAVLVWLHVATRNLWREFVRESLDEPRLGRRELEHVVTWTAQLAADFSETYGDILPCGMQSLFRQVAEDFLVLGGFVRLPEKTKLQLRIEGCRHCGAIVSDFDKYVRTSDAVSDLPDFGESWPRGIWEAAEHVGRYPLPLLQTHSPMHEKVRTFVAQGNEVDIDEFMDILRSSSTRESREQEASSIGAKDAIDSKIDQILQNTDKLPSATREEMRADLILKMRYSSEHVAYRDVWTVDQSGDAHLYRHVIAHGAGFSAVYNTVESWRQQNPQLSGQAVELDFIEASPSIPTPELNACDL